MAEEVAPVVAAVEVAVAVVAADAGRDRQAALIPVPTFFARERILSRTRSLLTDLLR